jgi:hypothetical protein
MAQNLRPGISCHRRITGSRRAREAKSDQEQPLEIPGFQVRKAGGNRTAMAGRQRFPACEALKAGDPSIWIHGMFFARGDSSGSQGGWRALRLGKFRDRDQKLALPFSPSRRRPGRCAIAANIPCKFSASPTILGWCNKRDGARLFGGEDYVDGWRGILARPRNLPFPREHSTTSASVIGAWVSFGGYVSRYQFRSSPSALSPQPPLPRSRCAMPVTAGR